MLRWERDKNKPSVPLQVELVVPSSSHGRSMWVLPAKRVVRFVDCREGRLDCAQDSRLCMERAPADGDGNE